MKLFDDNLEKLLTELEAQREIYWNLPRESASLIYFLAKARKARKVLEIGTSNGYSAIWWAKAIESENGQVFTVESHPGRRELALENFKTAKVEHLTNSIRGHAPEALNEVDEVMEGGFDMIFLDATKREHLSYFETVKSLLNQNGLLIADNVLSHQDKMQEYVDFVSAQTDFFSDVFEIGTGLMISIKK